MYAVFEKLLKERGVNALAVSKATGISTGTLSDWKAGRIKDLKADKLKLIADYFGVSVNYLMTGEHPEQISATGQKYYFSNEAAEAAQELFENKDLRALMSAARDVSPEAIQAAATLLKAWKETNPDG